MLRFYGEAYRDYLDGVPFLAPAPCGRRTDRSLHEPLAGSKPGVMAPARPCPFWFRSNVSTSLLVTRRDGVPAKPFISVRKMLFG